MQDILEMDLNNDWEVGRDFTAKNQYRKFETNIPRKRIDAVTVPISTFMWD
jgi:hypothetical protein